MRGDAEEEAGGGGWELFKNENPHIGEWWEIMVFHRFSIGLGSGENPDSLNLSLGWPSVWRAKVMVFKSNRFP